MGPGSPSSASPPAGPPLPCLLNPHVAQLAAGARPSTGARRADVVGGVGTSPVLRVWEAAQGERGQPLSFGEIPWFDDRG